ncbi:SelL-related redox protein [Stieleria sp. TO1_6]|uniref:SelL-related redox protein n=1 Tax=Stieleria tagensis TaxID=2956795 RepID=UPI00209BB368|nr:SelL-related redox protein [Stieleria tagensis]MCO8122048.1 SelL-related redox protein [Stieleria tagensis]
MNYQPKWWMRLVLLLGGLANLSWALLSLTIPGTVLNWSGLENTATTILLWRCIGMIIGVYGIGFLIASRHPYRHWPIVLLGFVGKLLGAIGCLIAIPAITSATQAGWLILANEALWLVPFAVILWGALRYQYTANSAYEMPEADAPIQDLRTNAGRRLDDLANQRPQLVVFLRHAGCTFCREAMAELSRRRDQIEATGCGIVLVHLGKGDGESFFQQYAMQDVPRISDPECRLYRQFGLDLGGFHQLFGLRVWLRGIVAGVFHGHGIGRAQGNTFQMPGVFTYYHGQVIEGYQHELASDQPDYLELARRATQPMAA